LVKNFKQIRYQEGIAIFKKFGGAFFLLNTKKSALFKPRKSGNFNKKRLFFRRFLVLYYYVISLLITYFVFKTLDSKCILVYNM
jgi:hypothetical protein